MLYSCKSDQEKLDDLIEASELTIQENTYGGLMGYYESFHRIYSAEGVKYLIINEGTEMEEVLILTSEKQSQFDVFLEKSFESNDQSKHMSNSCMGIDIEYIITAGYTELNLKPDQICEDLFNEILYK